MIGLLVMSSTIGWRNRYIAHRCRACYYQSGSLLIGRSSWYIRGSCRNLLVLLPLMLLCAGAVYDMVEVLASIDRHTSVLRKIVFTPELLLLVH